MEFLFFNGSFSLSEALFFSSYVFVYCCFYIRRGLFYVIFTVGGFDSVFFILRIGNTLVLNEMCLLTNIISLYDAKEECES